MCLTKRIKRRTNYSNVQNLVLMKNFSEKLAGSISLINTVTGKFFSIRGGFNFIYGLNFYSDYR